MKKEDLENVLKSLDITFNEGITYLEKNDIYPRIVFFEYLWDDIVSSNTSYQEVVSYQISFKSHFSRDPKLIDLKKKLNRLGYHPKISHEYISSKKEWHSYFSLDILENVS